MRKPIYILVVSILVSCHQEKTCPKIDKPIEYIKTASDLSQRLHNDILDISYEVYRDSLDKLTDTVNIHKCEIAYQLYETEKIVNSISYDLKIAVLSKANNLTKDQDTTSYEYILNNYTRPFTTNLLSDTTIKNKFVRLVTYHEKILRVKEGIIKTQTGKGRIICRDLGRKLSLSDLNSATDYWDLLYLIENSHCTISKEILCTFSNLSCYKTEIRWRFWTRYSGNPDETIRQTRYLKKRENGT